MRQDAQGYLRCLKPGGEFGDYSAKAGAGVSVVHPLHRSDEALITSEIETAGFQLMIAAISCARQYPERHSHNAPHPVGKRSVRGPRVGEDFDGAGERHQIEPEAEDSGDWTMLTWHPVDSTSIRAIGYDPDTHEAFVEFLRRSGPYVYKGISPEVYDGLEQAPRKGPYVNHVIKQYPFEHRERWPASGKRIRRRRG